MWCNIGYAALISYYNLKLQDNIADHFTPEQINQFYMNDVRYVTNYKGEKLLGRDLKYSMISIKEEDKKIFIEDFPSIIIQIYYENKTDKIVSISQSRKVTDFNNCLLTREKEVNKYKKKNRIKSFFEKFEGKETRPDGVVDHSISFQGPIKYLNFKCEVHTTGVVVFRKEIGEWTFGDFIFEKIRK